MAWDGRSPLGHVNEDFLSLSSSLILCTPSLHSLGDSRSFARLLPHSLSLCCPVLSYSPSLSPPPIPSSLWFSDPTPCSLTSFALPSVHFMLLRFPGPGLLSGPLIHSPVLALLTVVGLHMCKPDLGNRCGKPHA